MTPSELKVIRKNYKLTQEGMAKQLGVSRLTVFNWEKGKFAIPADIVDRLAKADLAAPAQQADAVKAIGAQSHPHLYWIESGRNGRPVRKLAHPRWWCGPGSPFERLCSREQWNAECSKLTTAIDLKTYIPPTPQQAYEIMVARGISDKDARDHLAWIRSPLPGHVETPRISMSELTDGEVTDDTIGT
jgi:transcriptional regulator with XRE-family HTH domain